MATKTEPLHTGGFIISEANGFRSREVATVVSGQNLVVGEVVQLDVNGKLTAADGIPNSDDLALDTAVVGIMHAAVDASAADVANAVYIARDAEVNDADITYPDETSPGTEKEQTVASLLLVGIVTR